MWFRSWIPSRVFLLLALCLPAACAEGGGNLPAGVSGPAELRPTGVPAQAQEASVAQVVDGDTLRVVATEPGSLPEGEEVRIRVLEIDSPEMGFGGRTPECGALAATRFAEAELPAGSTVYLLADREDKDLYDRYLRYVWDSEGEFFDEKAARLGHARAVLYEPNDRFIDAIEQAEAEAREQGLGIWGPDCRG